MITLNYTQLVAGSGLPYLSEVMSDRSYVPASWLSSIRTLLRLCKGTVIIPNAWLPKPQCNCDQIIMDVFEHLCLPAMQLERLNAVQLYLGALTLADITTNDGTHIIDWALTGRIKVTPMIPWPSQGKPTEPCWALWRKLLKQCFSPGASRNHCLHKYMRLQQPLG
eukprot:4550744-Ditylum_brightwellii.AAC.1